MEGLKQNKPLMYSVVVSGGVVLALAAGIFPDLSTMFEIVEFPDEVSKGVRRASLFDVRFRFDRIGI